MSISKRLKSLNLPIDTIATLTFSEGVDVFHFNETEIETALQETSVVNEYASLISQTNLNVSNPWSGNVLQHLRDGDFLEDYVRGSGDFSGYLEETINENFYDIELIDYSTEKYDHKRGFTTLTAQVHVPVSDLIENDPDLSGWNISVSTDDMTTSFVA